MWRRPGTVQTISASGASGQAGAPIPPGPVSGSILVPNTSSRVTMSPGIIAGGTPPYGSVSFNGSNYLSTTGGAGTAMGTGNFTWECWVRPTTSSGYQAFIDTRGVQTGYSGLETDGAYFGLNFDTLFPTYYQNGSLIVSSIAVTQNAWTHVALVRNSGTTTLYVGGVSGGTYADSINFTAPYVDIGGTFFAPDLWLTGQISNLRMVKGTAVYTASFTPPTAPLTAISGTQLLLNTANDANFLVDSSTNDFTISNNGSVTSSSTSPFTYSNTPFTVEGWFYSTVTPGTNGGPVLIGNDGATNNALTVAISTSYNLIIDSSGVTSHQFEFAPVGFIEINTWYYVAVSRDNSGYIQAWIGREGDATAQASTARFATIGNASWNLSGLSNTIGTFVPASRSTTGYISNLRVDNTNLYATTAATIPVPTQPFTELAGTVFLQNDDTLTDQTGNQTLTAVGAAAGNALNPF